MAEPSCPTCGARLDAGSRFCGSCGAPVAAAVPSAPKATLLEAPPSLGLPPPPAFGRAEFSRPRAPVVAPETPRPRNLTPAEIVPGFPFARFAAGLAALVAAVAVLVVVVIATRTAPSASVRFDAGLPVLELVLSADEGTPVVLGGQRTVVHLGRAHLRLDPTTLVVGENAFRVHVGDDVEVVSADVPVVAYLDVAALAADPPVLGVVVRTRPFSVVTVDGHTVPADATGMARAGAPARLDGGLDEHVAEVIAHVGGTAHHLRVHLRAEPATLRVRQPPIGFVTDRSALDLVAEVAPDARVTVDGREVAHDGTRVRTVLSLGRVGDFRFRLDVLEPNKRRRVEMLTLRRVEDLAVAAEVYPTVEGVTYESFAHAPHSGDREAVKLSGLVTHVRIEAGRSYVEMRVEPCATAAGCPLWIEYPAATLAHVDDRITVRGPLRGMAEYRTVGSDTRHAPMLEAAFLTVESR